MPTPPYARALVSKNGGTAVAGTITALTTDSLQLSPESTVGWQKCRWLLTFDSPGFTAPAGWILDTDGSITGVIGGYWYAASGGSYNPPAFTPSPWGKWVWKLLVNGAVDGAATQSLIDLAGGAKVLSPNGLTVVAPFEQGQFSGNGTLWTPELSKEIRAADVAFSILGGGGARSGQATHVMASDANDALSGGELLVARVIVTSGVALTATRNLTTAAPASNAASYGVTIYNNTTGGQSLNFGVGTGGIPFGNTRVITPGQQADLWVEPGGVSFRDENNS